jgi:hypothetical protein
MTIERQVKVYSALMVASTLITPFYFEGVGREALFLFSPFLIGCFAVIYYFYRGRNWARLLVIGGSVLGVLSVPMVFSAPSLRFALAAAFDGALSVMLLGFLPRRDARDYFQRARPAVPARWKATRMILIATLVVAALVGALTWMIRTVIHRVEKSQVWIEDLESGQASALTDAGMNTQPRFSPDGSLVAYVSRADSRGTAGSSLRVHALADGAARTVFEDRHLILSPSWGPGGRSLVFARRMDGRTDLWRYELDDGRLTRITDDAGVEENPQASPNGRWIVFEQEGEDGKPALHVVPLEGGPKKVLAEAADFLHEPKLPAWSPDSGQVAYVSFLSLVVHHLASGRREVIDIAGLNNAMGLSFWPADPQVLVLKARPADSTGLQFNLYRVSRATGKAEIWKTGLPMLDMHHDFSPDGKRVVYSRA